MGVFSRKENVSKFAQELCDYIAVRYPVSMDLNTQTMVSEKNLSKVLERAFVDAAEFKTRNKLGVYGKAKLLNAFRWGLKDMGYSDKFIKLAVEGMTAYTAQKK